MNPKRKCVGDLTDFSFDDFDVGRLGGDPCNNIYYARIGKPVRIKECHSWNVLY